ncbi:MAG: hypothetical protein AAF556_08230 [Pseudomonadota bacterium]
MTGASHQGSNDPLPSRERVARHAPGEGVLRWLRSANCMSFVSTLTPTLSRQGRGGFGHSFVLILLCLTITGCAELRALGVDVEPPAFEIPDAPDISGRIAALTAPAQESIAMIAPVRVRSVTEFRAQPHLGVEVETQGFSRRPYFIAPPAQIVVTPGSCEALFLAADPEGTAPLQLENFMIVELAQGAREQIIGLGHVEPFTYKGQNVPILGGKRRIIPAGDFRLDRLFQPGQPATITLTPLTNGDRGGMSAVFLIQRQIGRLITDDGGVQRCEALPNRQIRPVRTAPQMTPQLAPQASEPTIIQQRQPRPQPPSQTLPEGFTTAPPSASSGQGFDLDFGGEPTSLPDRQDR